MAEASQEKNAKLKEALGISNFFVEGSSLDPDRKNREAQAAAEAHKQLHSLVPDSESSPEPEQRSKKKKKSEKEAQSKRAGWEPIT